MQWRAAGDGFLGPRGMRTQVAGEERWRCRCGRTIEAQPLFDQTCQIEAALAAPTSYARMDGSNGHIDRLGICRANATSPQSVAELSVSMAAPVSDRLHVVHACSCSPKIIRCWQDAGASHNNIVSCPHEVRSCPLTPDRTSRAVRSRICDQHILSCTQSQLIDAAPSVDGGCVHGSMSRP